MMPHPDQLKANAHENTSLREFCCSSRCSNLAHKPLRSEKHLSVNSHEGGTTIADTHTFDQLWCFSMVNCSANVLPVNMEQMCKSEII